MNPVCDNVTDTSNTVNALSRQLGASLEMLTTAINNATEDVWITGTPPLWQIGFHITNSVDFYMSTFNPEFETPVDQYLLPQNMKRHAGKGFFDKHHNEVVSKIELLGFVQSTRDRIRDYFLNDLSPQLTDESGFPWLPMTKLELIMYNIRHIMEHTAIINQILKANGIQAAGWTGIAEL